MTEHVSLVPIYNDVDVSEQREQHIFWTTIIIIEYITCVTHCSAEKKTVELISCSPFCSRLEQLRDHVLVFSLRVITCTMIGNLEGLLLEMHYRIWWFFELATLEMWGFLVVA